MKTTDKTVHIFTPECVTVAFTVSANWEYEDLAILSAEGHRARGNKAVVVGNTDIGFFVFSWN